MDHPAIDEQVDAGNERRLVGQQVADGRRHLLRIAEATQRRPLQHLAHHRLLGQLQATHGGVDQTRGHGVHPPSERTPPHRGPLDGMDHAPLGQGVGVAAVGDDARDPIEEVGRTRIVDQRVLVGLDERRDLIGGRRREADGGGTGLDERLERLEEEVGAHQVDLEHPASVAHGG